MALTPQDATSILKCYRQMQQLPWKWILEKILQHKEINVRVAQGITNYIPDIEDQHCSGLQERLALRYLEELVETQPTNARIIPLVKALVKDDVNHIKLLLWVQTEATLHFLRGCEEKKEKDWIGFANAIDYVFHEENVGMGLARKLELSALLKDENREEHCNQWFQKYPVATLRKNLLQFIEEQKASVKSTFLDKLVQDSYSGFYDLSLAPQKVHFDPEHGDIHSVQVYQLNLSSRKTQAIKDELKASLPSPMGDVGDEMVYISLENTCKGEATANNHPAKEVIADINGTFVQTCHTPGDLSEEMSLACRLRIMRNKKRQSKFSSHKQSQRKMMDTKFTEVKSIKSIETGKDFSGLGAESDKNIVPSSDSGQENIDDEGFISETQAIKDVECFELENGHEEICCKCKRQGKLLHCHGCPMAVHVKCIEQSTGQIGTNFEWFCPICTYKAARIAYHKAKKAVLLAKKLKCSFVDAMKSRCERHADYAGQDGNANQGTESSRKTATYCTDLPVNEFVAKKIPESGCGKGNSGPEKLNRIDCEEMLRSSLHSVQSASPEIEIHGSHWPGNFLQGQDRDGHDTNARNRCDISFVAHVSPYDFDAHEQEFGANQANRITKRGRQNIPGLRRKNLPWTKLEEEVLKEGIKQYSKGDGSWGFQWARILEYGYGKFHESRTSNDLKDKWRNLTKTFSMETDKLGCP